MAALASGSFTILNLSDGLSVFYEYAKNGSSTTPPAAGWSAAMPQSEAGKFIWRREGRALSHGDVTSWGNPMCLTGATGAAGPQGPSGVGITGVTEYYLASAASSGVTVSTSGWTTSMQSMTASNRYLWNFERISFSNGTSQDTQPVIIGVYGNTGATGATGATGRSITAVTEYYLATGASSGVTRATAGWTTGMQVTTLSNRYLWNYGRIDWSSGTTPTYVEPVIIGVHGATGPTGPQGPAGPQGPMGNPGQLGLYADGVVLHLKGFADDGTLTAPVGNIYGEGQRYVVPAFSQTLVSDGKGYVVFDGSVVQTARLVADGSSKRWTLYENQTPIGEGFWVLGAFTKTGALVSDIRIFTPRRSQQFELFHFMEIIAEGDMENINVWAQASGVGAVFARIAALQMFVNSLTSNEGFIDEFYSHSATIGAVLKTANYAESDGIPTAGFLLDGLVSLVKMYDAVFGRNCTFYGKLLHPLLKTREAVIGNPITIPVKTHWGASSLKGFIDGCGIPANTLVQAAGSCRGLGIEYVIRSTGTNVRLFTVQSQNAGATLAVPFNGTVYLYAKGINAVNYDAYVDYNGVRQVHSNTAAVSAKTITVARNGTLYGFSASSSVMAYADLVLPQAGYYLVLSDGSMEYVDGFKADALTLSLSGNTWNSSGHLEYVHGQQIISLMEPLSKGVTLGASGTLVIDGVPRVITSVISHAAHAVFQWDSTPGLDVLSGGFYDMSGTFLPEAVTAGVLTDILLPLVPADSGGGGKDIGSSASRYRAVYARQVHAETVWGAVAN